LCTNLVTLNSEHQLIAYFLCMSNLVTLNPEHQLIANKSDNFESRRSINSLLFVYESGNFECRTSINSVFVDVVSLPRLVLQIECSILCNLTGSFFSQLPETSLRPELIVLKSQVGEKLDISNSDATSHRYYSLPSNSYQDRPSVLVGPLYEVLLRTIRTMGLTCQGAIIQLCLWIKISISTYKGFRFVFSTKIIALNIQRRSQGFPTRNYLVPGQTARPTYNYGLREFKPRLASAH
jgi:hypothetical protein